MGMTWISSPSQLTRKLTPKEKREEKINKLESDIEYAKDDILDYKEKISNIAKNKIIWKKEIKKLQKSLEKYEERLNKLTRKEKYATRNV